MIVFRAACMRPVTSSNRAAAIQPKESVQLKYHSGVPAHDAHNTHVKHVVFSSVTRVRYAPWDYTQTHACSANNLSQVSQQARACDLLGSCRFKFKMRFACSICAMRTDES